MAKLKTSLSLVNSQETLQNNNISIRLINIELPTSSQSHVAGNLLQPRARSYYPAHHTRYHLVPGVRPSHYRLRKCCSCYWSWWTACYRGTPIWGDQVSSALKERGALLDSFRRGAGPQKNQDEARVRGLELPAPPLPLTSNPTPTSGREKGLEIELNHQWPVI